MEALLKTLSEASNNDLYTLLIAAKNEWNQRAASLDDFPQMKKVYLHFENQLQSPHK